MRHIYLESFPECDACKQLMSPIGAIGVEHIYSEGVSTKEKKLYQCPKCKYVKIN